MRPDFRFLDHVPPAEAGSFLSMWREMLAIAGAPRPAAELSGAAAVWHRWLTRMRQSPDSVWRDLDRRPERFSDLSADFRAAMATELRASLPADQAGAVYLNEMLDALHYVVKSGTEWSNAAFSHTERRLVIDGHQVMDAWETPIMHAMVDGCLAACRGASRTGRPRVLELGWGMGISGGRFLENDVDYTVVEAHAATATESARAIELSRRPGRVVPGLWQDAEFPPASFDAIFFDAYYTTFDREKYGDYLRTAAAHFFPLLADGGVFTFFLGNHPGQIPILLDAGFGSVTCSRVTGIVVPEDCSYAPPGELTWLNILARKGGVSA